MRESTDAIVARVCRMQSEALMRELRLMSSPARMEYTHEFLAAQSVDRLRHLLLAAHLQVRSAEQEASEASETSET